MTIRQRRLAVSLLTVSFAVSAMAASNASNSDKARQIVLANSQGQVTIKQEFPSVGNLEGFVIQSKREPGREMVVYADKDGQYMIVGAVIDKDGVNLVQKDTMKYIQPQIAKAAYDALPETQSFIEGNPKAKHVMYAVVEPNCSICHRLYEQVGPFIKSGDLAVHWIMVDFLNQTSKGKAAAIMQSKNPGEAWAYNEAHFDLATENGGAKPTTKILPETLKKLQANWKFMQKFGFPGTPVVLYKDISGQPQLIMGPIVGKDVKTVIDTMSN